MAPEVKTQVLPPRESALFKRIVKCYEHKQYRNGLKFAKQLLQNPKFAEHGETLAMKGLILNCIGRREEARDHITRGLRADLQSHVCWHVFGLLQRSEKRYDEAIKAYRNALKRDKDNIQILRELSVLQVQLRDFEGFKETRYQLFVSRPSQRASWVGYAIAQHLLGNCDMALRLLQEFSNAQSVKTYDYEHSELLLYETMVMQESGKLESALAHLKSNATLIGDKVALMQKKAEIMHALKRNDEAADIYRALIRRNPENHAYYCEIEKCLGLDVQPFEQRMRVYHDSLAVHPKAGAPKRLPLNFATDDDFIELLGAYIRTALRKGIPALFVDLRNLYKDEKKVKQIHDLLEVYRLNLTRYNRFTDSEEGPEEPPTTLLWLHFFLAQHYDHLADYDAAIRCINEAKTHTPTLIDLYIIQAKVCKHIGAFQMAASCMDEAQALDTADRGINSKCAKYMLRANRVADAEAMTAKFTREGTPALENLNEMQCMWFELELANAYKRMGKHGEALKMCFEIDRHFEDITEDQYDFHTYCVRKMTLSSYIELLRLEDQLRRHPFYAKTAMCAVRIYLRLHDSPPSANNGMNGSQTEDSAEQRKRRNKEAKARAKANQAKEQERLTAEKAKAKQQAQNKEKADDTVEQSQAEKLDPQKLLTTDTPLDEAARFIRPLLALNCSELDAYTLGFEVYLRRNRCLLMLRCLLKAVERSANSSRVHTCKVKFLHWFAQNKEACATIDEEVISNALGVIFPTGVRDASLLNREYLKSNRHSLSALHAVAQCMTLLKESDEEAVSLVTNAEISKLQDFTWSVCALIVRSLVTGRVGTAIGRAKASAFRQWLHTNFFAYSDELSSLSTEELASQTTQFSQLKISKTVVS